MTWYLAVAGMQPPIDALLDDSGRAQYSFNVFVTRAHSIGRVIDELAAVLVAAHVGTDRVDIFRSSSAVIPDGAGPYLQLRATGGTVGMGTHNDGPDAYQRLTVNVITRAGTDASRAIPGAAPAAEAMAVEAYAALVAVRNRTITLCETCGEDLGALVAVPA